MKWEKKRSVFSISIPLMVGVRAEAAKTKNPMLSAEMMDRMDSNKDGRVWGYDIIVTQRSVDRCINSLRSKLGNPAYIQTVREIGYRFDPDV